MSSTKGGEITTKKCQLLLSHFSRKNPVDLQSIWTLYMTSQYPGPFQAAKILSVLLVELRGPVKKSKRYVPGSNNSWKNAGRMIDRGIAL